MEMWFESGLSHSCDCGRNPSATVVSKKTAIISLSGGFLPRASGGETLERHGDRRSRFNEHHGILQKNDVVDIEEFGLSAKPIAEVLADIGCMSSL
ncbi:hypothetical protein AKJ16_DCAP10558 [Drosera capensis]